MTRRPRRNHGPAFEARSLPRTRSGVALEAVKGERTLADPAQRLYVHPNLISKRLAPPRRKARDRLLGIYRSAVMRRAALGLGASRKAARIASAQSCGLDRVVSTSRS